MTKYEQLLDEASKKIITVIENYDLTCTQLDTPVGIIIFSVGVFY